MSRKGKKAKKKYHIDEQGHYIWETYFVRGKQRRSKVRVTVIDGEIIDDMDDWLISNAGDDVLHELERWDLIGQSELDDQSTPTVGQAVKAAPRELRLDITEFETAFEFLSENNADFFEDRPYAFLDLTNGKVVNLESAEDNERYFCSRNFLELPNDLFEDLYYGALREFMGSLPKDPQRDKLARAIRGKKPFRRFKAFVFGGKNVALKHRWLWFEKSRKRKRIVEWLREENINPDWGHDIFAHPDDDVQNLQLDRALIAAPPLELCPQIDTRVDLPSDVDEELVDPIQAWPSDDPFWVRA